MDSRDKWRAQNLRLDPSLIGVAKPRPKPKRSRVHGLFIRGPVPWRGSMRPASYPACRHCLLGIELWHLCGRNYNKLTFSVSNWLPAEVGLSRNAKYRALAASRRGWPDRGPSLGQA